MSWNPNQGQDPNSQYGGYNPNMQPPPAQPTDPYSAPQSGYQQYGQPGQPGQPCGSCPVGVVAGGLGADHSCGQPG